MNCVERRQCMWLLHQAQHGRADVYEELTSRLSRNFEYMIYGFHSVDPAYDRDDLMSQFRIGIWRSIPKVDNRGDPLFHLAWRGKRAVSSLLAAIRQRRYGTDLWIDEHGERSIGTLPNLWDPPDLESENQPEDCIIDQENREEARQHVTYLLTRLNMTLRQREVVDWMMTDPDIEEKGANLRLAHALGVSPQMASKYRRTVTGLLVGYTEEAPLDFCCTRCGRGFRSKGALTQHKVGQSGHQACPAS